MTHYSFPEYIHTYIHNWPLQPFSQDYGLALMLYVSGGTYNLTSTSNDKFLGNFFMAGLFTLRVLARNLLRGNRRRNIFHISFLTTDLGYEPRLLRLISRHIDILDHGDFHIHFPNSLLIFSNNTDANWCFS